MNAKNLTRAIVTLILFISLSFIVSASIDVNYYSTATDFNLRTGATELSLCQCAVYTDSIKIENVAATDAKFQVTTDLEFVHVVESLFSIEQGGSGTVHLQIPTPCDAEGAYTVNILVENNLGKQKTITKQLNIGKCQNLNVDFFAENVTEGIEPCSSIDFNLIITNPGVFQEQYSIRMSAFEDSTVISENDFFLQPQTSKNVSLKTNFPCDVYGNQDIVFDVRSVMNGLEVSIPFNVDILQNYNFSLDLLHEPNYCYEDGARKLDVMIDNLVEVPNNYSLRLLGAPSFVSLEQDSVDLGPGENKTVSIVVGAEKKYQAEYDFTLHVESGAGDTMNDLPVHLVVHGCYDPKIILDVASADVCQDHYEYDVKIRNDGRFTEEIEVGLFGPDFVSLSNDSLVLDPGEEEVLVLSVDAPDLETDNYVTIKVTYTRNGHWVTEDFHLKTYDTEGCFKIETEENEFRIYTGANRLDVPVKSLGIAAGTYEVLLDNSQAEWITLGDESLELWPGETKEIRLFADLENKTYGDYEVTLVLIKELDDEDLFYSSVLKIKFTDAPFSVKLWTYIYHRPCMLALGILSILFIVSLIMVIAFKTKLGRKKPGKVWIPLIVLAAIFIIAVLFVVYQFGPLMSLYPSVVPSDNRAEIHWAEDTTYKLNLSEYFMDPDDDALAFTATDTKHVDIKFMGEIAYLKPETDWFGEETINFFAEDEEGEMAESPFMTLKVFDMPEYTCREGIEFYCGYINLVLLLFVLLFVYIMFYKKAGSGRPTKVQREALAEAETKNGNNKNNSKKAKKKK